MAVPRLPWSLLAAFILAGCVVRIVAATALPTIERPDEIYQNLEPAYRYLTGHGIITWEWRDGIRSWLFPIFLSGIISLASSMHLPDDATLPLIWASLSVVSAGVVAAGILMGWRRFGYAGAVLCGILTAFWPDLVYFGPKTLGEVQAGNLLVVAASLASTGPVSRDWRRLSAIGFLLGTAFDLRFQLSLSLMLVAVWAVRSSFFKGSLPLILGAAVPLIVLGVVDWWMLGSPFQSVWKNIQVNLFEHRADSYGVSSVSAYLYLIISRNGAAAVLMSIFFVYGFRSAPLLAVTAISVVGFHSIISHKEISFVYAALPCAMIVVGLGVARFVAGLSPAVQWRTGRWSTLTLAAAFTLATVAATAMAERPFSPSSDQTALRRLFVNARAQPDMCGLGLVGEEYFPWFATGGYTQLRRDVPIFLTLSEQDFAEGREGFNYAITQRLMLKSIPDFNIVSCTLGYCLVRREAGCRQNSTYEINEVLSRAGQ